MCIRDSVYSQPACANSPLSYTLRQKSPAENHRFTTRIAAPRTARTIPVTRFKTIGEDLLANFAAIRAHNSVLKMQHTRQNISGMPPMAKWLTAVSYTHLDVYKRQRHDHHKTRRRIEQNRRHRQGRLLNRHEISNIKENHTECSRADEHPQIFPVYF